MLGFNALRLLVCILPADENVHFGIGLEAEMQSMAWAARARMGKLADLIFHHGHRPMSCLTSPSSQAFLLVSS
jgi:hypothetical protein